MSSREERAWAAGLFDGEGTTHFHGGSITLSLEQAASGLMNVKRFHQIIGGAFYGPYSETKRSARYVVKVRGYDKVITALFLLDEWLGIPKREQALLALQKYHTNINEVNLRRKQRHQKHGTMACYRRGCQREECHSAFLNYYRDYSKQKSLAKIGAT